MYVSQILLIRTGKRVQEPGLEGARGAREKERAGYARCEVCAA